MNKTFNIPHSKIIELIIFSRQIFNRFNMFSLISIVLKNIRLNQVELFRIFPIYEQIGMHLDSCIWLRVERDIYKLKKERGMSYTGCNLVALNSAVGTSCSLTCWYSV